MPKSKHYSPQLSRELVSKLYRQAKSERIPMTVLTNHLVEEALGTRKLINKPIVAENKDIMDPN
jgi:hypothetical protein